MRWGIRVAEIVVCLIVGFVLGTGVGLEADTVMKAIDMWYSPQFISHVPTPKYPPPLLTTPTSDMLNLELQSEANVINFENFMTNFNPAPRVIAIWDNRLNSYDLYGETFLCRPSDCLVDGKIASYCINSMSCFDVPKKPGDVFIVALIKDDYLKYIMTKHDEETLIHELQHVACYPEKDHGDCFQMGMKKKALNDYFKDIW